MNISEWIPKNNQGAGKRLMQAISKRVGNKNSKKIRKKQLADFDEKLKQASKQHAGSEGIDVNTTKEKS